MAGELAIVERETAQNSLMAARQWRWRAQYSRFFSYPSSFLSSISTNNNNDDFLVSLSTLDKKNFKPLCLSSVDSFTVSLQPSDQSPALSVLTVSFRDDILADYRMEFTDSNVSQSSYLTFQLEEHYVSRLHFVWPQVSCLSGFPTRGSLVVLACYIDSEKEKQKFALRFSTPSETENFITSMEDILSNKLPKEPSAVDVPSPISSQSEFIPPYRPDTSNMMSPIYASSEPNNFHNENQQESQYQIQDLFTDSESNGVAFPPRFTSLLSSCAVEPKQNALALALIPELQEPDLKSQMAKYMQDASFLDIVSKVNEVITELGCDFTI